MNLPIRVAGAIATILVLTLPSVAFGQSLFAGVYTGTFTGPFSNGQFAILLRENNTAIIAGYDAIDLAGFVNENVTVNPDGSFSHSNIDGRGASVTGTFTSSGVSGTFVDVDGSGPFSGTKRPTTGLFSDAGGYYTGTLSGTVTLDGVLLGSWSGSVSVIAAADGAAFMFAHVSGVFIGVFLEAEDGGLFTIASNGSINTTLLGARTLLGT